MEIESQFETRIKFPAAVVDSYRDQLQKFDDKDSFTDIERVEAYEVFGTALFYNGEYSASIVPLTTAVEMMRDIKELAKCRKFYYLSIMVGIAHFRLGEIQLAEKFIVPCTTHKPVDPDLQAIACSDLAWLRLHQHRLNEACDRAIIAVEHAHKAFPPDSEQFFRCLRVLLITYIKCGDFTKADMVIEEYDFPRQEKVILRAGCWLYMGMVDEALIILREESYKIPGTQAALEYHRIHQQQLESSKLRAPVDSHSDAEDESPRVRWGNDEFGGGGGGGGYNAQSAVDDLRLLEQAAEMEEHAQPAEATIKDKYYNALVLYNLSALYIRQHGYSMRVLAAIDDGIAELKKYIEGVEAVRQDASVCSLLVPPELISVQYLDRPGSMNIPFCISTDEFSAPLVLLSHLCSAKAELTLLANRLDCASLIQSGEVITTDDRNLVNDLAELFRTVGAAVDEAKQVLTHELMFDEPDPSLSEGPLTVGGQIDSSRNTSRPSTAANSRPQSGRVARSAAEAEDDEEDKVSSAAAALGAHRSTIVEYNIWKPDDADKKAEEEVEVAHVQRTNFDTSAAQDMLNNYLATLEMAGGLPEKYSDVSKRAISLLKTRYAVEENAAGHLITKKNITRHVNQYISPVHDPVSIRSEIFPLMGPYGNDDVTCWVQWAVAQTRGFGFGFMGTASRSTTATGPVTFATDTMNRAELEMVREKLAAVDKKLAKKFDDDRKHKTGDRERILLLNAVLAKVCSQLGLRKETGLCVKRMEELMTGIISCSDRSVAQSGAVSGKAAMKMKSAVYDPSYVALVKRFKLDFEEWDISEDMISSARKKVMRLMECLRFAKEYMAAAEEAGDPQLKRDSVKKIANLYLEIVAAPLVDKTPAKGKRGSNSRDDEGEEEVDETPATELQLSKFSAEAIDENEAEDPMWVKRFGKLRAQQYLTRLSTITAK